MIVLGLDWAYSSQGPNQTKGPKQVSSPGLRKAEKAHYGMINHLC